MNQLVYQLGWIVKGFELLAVLWLLLKYWKEHRWALLFTRRQALISMQLHEMHSCFMTALVIFLFHIFSSEVEQYLVSLNFEQVHRIKVFYTGLMVQKFTLLVTLYTVHRIKGCLFSQTARVSMYMTVLFMSLLMMQLISRGYCDYHDLNMVYTLGGWGANLAIMVSLYIYPIRETFKYFTERREHAET